MTVFLQYQQAGEHFLAQARRNWPSASWLRYNALRADGAESVDFAEELTVSTQVIMRQIENHKLAHVVPE